MWHTGLAAPWHVESPQTRDQTCVSALADRLLTTDCQGNPYFFFLLWFSVIYKKLLPQLGSQKFTAIDSFKVFMVLTSYIKLIIWGFCMLLAMVWKESLTSFAYGYLFFLEHYWKFCSFFPLNCMASLSKSVDRNIYDFISEFLNLFRWFIGILLWNIENLVPDHCNKVNHMDLLFPKCIWKLYLHYNVV